MDTISQRYAARRASSDTYHIQPINSSITSNSFHYNAIKLSNKIPQSIEYQISRMRKKIKTNVLNMSL